MDEITTYSETHSGDKRNYYWSVRFDETGGYVGIQQTGDENTRVILSPKQVEEFLKFLKKQGVAN
jgi:hypothetical protein